MKTENHLNCKKITIECEGQTLVFVTKGSARVDTFDNGVLEVRTFLAAKSPAKTEKTTR